MSDLIDRLRALGAKADMFILAAYIGTREQTVEVPLALLDELISFVEESESRQRRGRRKTDLGKTADTVVATLQRWDSRDDSRAKSEILDFLQNLLDLTKPQVKALRSSVDRLLRQDELPNHEVVCTKQKT